MGYNTPRHGRQSAGQKAAAGTKAAIGVTVVAGVTAAVAATGAPAAFAAPLPLVTAVTHVSNNADDGGNGIWGYDNFSRTLTVSQDTSVTPPADDAAWKATVTDTGTWRAVLGAFTPNQEGADLGLKITHNANGTFTGTASYSFDAPVADVPSAANVVKALNDNFTKPETGPDSTSQWYLQAFLPAQQAGVTGTGIENDWTWTYKDAAQSWTDSAANGDGQSTAAGNITGKVPAPVSRPHLYGGHVISVSNNDAQIGWKYGPGVHYVLARTFGYGFSVNGSPHVGFTSSDVGYWSGLAAGHTYDIELIPADANRQPLPNAQVGWITVVTTR